MTFQGKYKKEIGTLFIILISVAVFIGNFFVPLGFILWILFLIPLLTAFYIYDEKWLYPLVTAISVLILINLFTAPRAIPVSYALFNRGTGIITFFILATFMKDQKKSKRELLEFNSNLEQTVAKRTEQLEIANKELNSFSYSIAHDLKAPLRAINGFSNILKKNYGDKMDDDKKLIDIIIDNSNKSSRLIDDLLDFSKMRESEMVAAEMDMNKIVKEVYDELSITEKGRTIDFKINSLPAAKGDSSMIKQVWMNLISNALKFTKNKEKAEITIGSQPNENEFIYFIKDNGAGFDTKYINKLFQVFQRLHSAEEFEGNGIGLAIIKRIIERHKGRVWAEGKVNEGATFYFSLPILKKNYEL